MNDISEDVNFSKIRVNLKTSALEETERILWQMYLNDLIDYLWNNRQWFSGIKNYGQLLKKRGMITHWLIVQLDFIESYLDAQDPDVIEALVAEFGSDGSRTELVEIIEELVYLKQKQIYIGPPWDELELDRKSKQFDYILPRELARLYRGQELELGHLIEQCPELILEISLF